MLGPVGRALLLLLVILVAAIAGRAFFENSHSVDETVLPAPPPPLPLPESARAAPAPPVGKPTAIVDPDPDLEQNTEATDCAGAPEPPAQPEPKDPVPH